MGLFHIATSCLRHFLQLLLALLEDEPSQGPLLGRYSPSAMEMVPGQNPFSNESDLSAVLSSSASHRFDISPNCAAPPSKLKPQGVCRDYTPIANARTNIQLIGQAPHVARLNDRRTTVQKGTHCIEPALSFALGQPPRDLPNLLNSELPARSCTSISVSSRSSIVSTPVLPGWSPETPITPTRQPSRKASPGGGKLVGLGIQILYDGDRSQQFDGLGLVPSRMTEPNAVEEEDLGVPSRILLEEIYNTFTSPETLGAAAQFPVEKGLVDDKTSVEDVFTARILAAQGPNAASTPPTKRSRQSYGLPTAASMRRARRVYVVETEEADESRSSDSSGGSSQKPVWRY
ncbi:hypothetical protein F5148DRAFT_1289380 [Russula earlei]|uniref:Uncharacterized protein n=1 Tax=Russula earlei TaxID=71964 RepID=A0ACC0TXU7_9AGAM|nr:hypothetical protein F5148DRAFT_1289380 [Russula earlei]